MFTYKQKPQIRSFKGNEEEVDNRWSFDGRCSDLLVLLQLIKTVWQENMVHSTLRKQSALKWVEKWVYYQFLPRDASAERGDATVSRLSVCDV